MKNRKPSRLMSALLVVKESWPEHKTKFNPRHQKIIKSVLLEGKTYEKAATETGTTKQAVYEVMKKLYVVVYGEKYNQKENELIIGIDPGTNGAIAYMTKKGKLRRIIDIPKEAKFSGKGEQVSVPLLSEELRQYKIKKAAVELVHSMPGNGGRAMFTFGRCLGVIEAILLMLEIEIVWVTPTQWKSKYGLARKEKDVARTVALQMYPQISAELKRKKDVDRAEAILIAKSIL